MVIPQNKMQNVYSFDFDSDILILVRKYFIIQSGNEWN